MMTFKEFLNFNYPKFGDWKQKKLLVSPHLQNASDIALAVQYHVDKEKHKQLQKSKMIDGMANQNTVAYSVKQQP